MAEQFATLEQIFQMFTPSDLVNTVEPNLGGSLSKTDNAIVQLLNLLENSGRGVLSIDDIVEQIKTLKTDKGISGGVDLSEFITIWKDDGIADLGTATETQKKAKNAQGKDQPVTSLKEIIGANFKFPTDAKPLKTSLILSRSPYFNPATRNTKKAEIFLNSMPSTVLSQLVPFIQVEFQFKREPSEKLASPGLLKFLLGASPVADSDKTIHEGHHLASAEKSSEAAEVDFAGMEMFTSPQTLVNPQPNSNVGVNGTRYSEVLDPFRPFLTLEHVNISAKPSGAGYYSYKTANMALKLHDRGRLSDIADLIRVNIYSGVTIWVTYGWRAPVRTGSNPYFDYVNNNLLMREAYQIKNSGFQFEQNGQVTINLELFTKGLVEMRGMKITDHWGDVSFELSKIKGLIEHIKNYRRILKLDPPEGPSKEIRAFKFLDAAESGEFPTDISAKEMNSKIAALEKSLGSRKDINKSAAAGLISDLKELYKEDSKGKFVEKERYESLVTQSVAEMFTEVRTGPDPFLPTDGKKVGADIIKICDSLNKVNGDPKKFRKGAVSFGKMFSVFALRAIQSLPANTVDEVQVFFYNMNGQCGPISNHSIAEFPIHAANFESQFADMAKEKATEKINLEDFIALIVDAQFTEMNALGYGYADLYADWKKGSELKLKDAKDGEGKLETRRAGYLKDHGPFKMPQIEMHIEMSHERVDAAGDTDILQQLNYSAKDINTVGISDSQKKSTRKIMRIHVYDKQSNPNKAAEQLLRSDVGGTHFINSSQNLDEYAKKFEQKKDQTLEQFKKMVSDQFKIDSDPKTGTIKFTDLSTIRSNQQIKDIVGKLVPTIRFGANGSTIRTANLSSKDNPLVKTRNILNANLKRNTATPAGGGAEGVPLRVIPATLQMTTMGCPLASMAQNYFIDFQTGTTLDNLYILTHLNHSFSPGKFETSWTFGFADGYGVFEGAPNIIDQIANIAPDFDATS